MHISKPIADGLHCTWAKYWPLLDLSFLLQSIILIFIGMPFSLILPSPNLPLALIFLSNTYELWGYAVKLAFPTDLLSIFWPLKPTPFTFKIRLFYPWAKSWFNCDLYRPMHSFSKVRLLFKDWICSTAIYWKFVLEVSLFASISVPVNVSF